ncbi:CPBP family intramembrane glutamic endopeptidase [Trujillonella endophytica]|uniref:CPBP family intramembrane glutamic endopeptidase n=1 Tax=Trujillonella endophytica TaxID=673521 RepID=UPI001FCDAE4B|nr:CPBP family intramembrane glutamic endopeptidase [Trujillella endophytica]
MTLRPVGSTRSRVFAAAVVGVLLVWNNLVVPRVPDPAYVAVNVTAAAVLVALARWSGLSWADLGLSGRRVPAGLRWGGAAFALVAVVLAVAVVVPLLRPLLTDARAADRDAAEVAGEVLVRIPLGTVLWEEVAFRGVLLAALLRVLPQRRAVGVGAVVFGVWHVRPTISGVAANDLADAAWLRALAVLGVCLFTAAAGVVFSWLRLRSGSLLAPVLLHLATNTLGTVAAATAHRLG